MMYRKVIYLIPLLILLLLAALFWRGLQLDPSALPSALLDKPVPEFGLPSLLTYNPDHPEENTLMTEQVFQGQVSLLHVWATWCAYCRVEKPVINGIAETSDVPIYSLNYRDDLQKARQWIEDLGNPYTDIGFDQAGRVAIDFGVYGTPEMFIIDHNGIIRHRRVGALNPQIWQEEFLPIIEKLQEKIND